MEPQSLPQTPIDGLSGIELKRSFLLTIQEYRKADGLIQNENILSLSNADIERLTRRVMALGANLEKMLWMIEDEESRKDDDGTE